MPAELDFYRRYQWCLNPFPAFRKLVNHLQAELNHLGEELTDWQRAEVIINIYLLGCQVSDTVDDFRLGTRHDFSKAIDLVPLAAPAARAFEALYKVPHRFRLLQRRKLWEWRESWEAAILEFLKNIVPSTSLDRNRLLESRNRLASLLEFPFPAKLDGQFPRVPSVFRSKDITHFDLLELGRRLVAEFPERRRPILLVGLRSAGSHMAPLLRAYLETEGYEDLDGVTLRPKRGVGSWENARLIVCARKKGLAVVADESPDSGTTLALAVRVLRRAGISDRNAFLLLPIHPAGRRWQGQPKLLSISQIRSLTLEPEEWHKNLLLESQRVEPVLKEYFQVRGYAGTHVVESPAAKRYTAALRGPAKDQWSTRLKRVYEVRLNGPDGRTETRFVVAKSLGWGWLGYHGFIAGTRLSGFVPPLLGQRDGIVFTELTSQGPPSNGPEVPREQIPRILASYVAARVRGLRLETDPSPRLCRDNRDNGFDRLATVLARAYGSRPAAFLKRPRLRDRLWQQGNSFPTLIDGKMRQKEWVSSSSSLLKADFAHHGMGKHQHNIVDPAYDLADAILHFHLSPDEETTLLDRYVGETGDVGVRGRLLLHKILAGRWAMIVARDNLSDPGLLHQHPDIGQQYLDAWTFLIVHVTRFCGSLCPRPEKIGWHGPLVLLDIDGVVDRNVFGFPSTTAAGIQALSLLNAHGVALACNTARGVAEVQEYCQAYGFAGGIAEYGSVLWDAVSGRERVLVSSESLEQLEKLRSALRQIPGVFVNERYCNSIRAVAFENDRTVSVPRILIGDVMESLHVDRLELKQNETDTTVVAKEVDKGQGLRALLEWIGQPDLDTVAIGDAQPDLPMFRAANRSYAPAHINCREAARLLGCHVSSLPYQPGLLEIARLLVHPDGRRCDRCRAAESAWPRSKNPFVELLETADQNRVKLLLRAMLDPMILRAFEV